VSLVVVRTEEWSKKKAAFSRECTAMAEPWLALSWMMR
jgi:hypothetical protein